MTCRVQTSDDYDSNDSDGNGGRRWSRRIEETCNRLAWRPQPTEAPNYKQPTMHSFETVETAQTQNGHLPS